VGSNQNTDSVTWHGAVLGGGLTVSGCIAHTPRVYVIMYTLLECRSFCNEVKSRNAWCVVEPTLGIPFIASFCWYLILCLRD
jgi:hypothetical protein